uniref:non-specific serine/threonine protein kinase n=1 Tax=Prasinoderma coloniale TaxID=156133 RepID=A0A7R9Y6T4_9VIRI|eukprot:PRCOL_00005285-RA
MMRNDRGSRDHAASKRRIDEVVRVLGELTGDSSKEFATDVRHHMKSMPERYRSDMMADRAGDVLMHMNLLRSVRESDGKLPAFNVRRVVMGAGAAGGADEDGSGHSGGIAIESPEPGTPQLAEPGSLGRPTFGSYTDISSLVKSPSDDLSELMAEQERAQRFEITFADRDRPRRLHLMSRCLGEVGLDICEAHAFSTNDRYLLNVFIASPFDDVDAGDAPTENSITAALEEEIRNVDWVIGRVLTAAQKAQMDGVRSLEAGAAAMALNGGDGRGSLDNGDDHHAEIDMSKLVKGQLIASGTFGRLHRGTYRGKEVAIKYLKAQELNETQMAEFKGEVAIMKQVHHPNVLRLVGAKTDPPEMCIVTEFMPGGSISTFRRQSKFSKGVPLGLYVKICLDIARGMQYLHQHNITHRDIKGANLLVAEDGAVRVADFGVARVIDMGGTMTAETGTYRWMAPEIISHQAYDVRCDVYSFAVVMWELWTGKVPYSTLTPMQAAVGVVQRGLRPQIPADMPQELAAIMVACWAQKPEARPLFDNVLQQLEAFNARVAAERTGTNEAKTAAAPVQLSGESAAVPRVAGSVGEPAAKPKKAGVLGGLKRMFSGKESK